MFFAGSANGASRDTLKISDVDQSTGVEQSVTRTISKIGGATLPDRAESDVLNQEMLRWTR
jgi:hypothetical protein